MTNVKTFKGRPCLSGDCDGLAEVSHIGVNSCATWSKVMLEGQKTGICNDHDNHDLFGHDLTDKILCLPQTVGSSSAATAFMGVLKLGVSPKAILFANHIDSLAACGLLMADIWQDQRCICVDNLGPDFLNAVKTGDSVHIASDGTITITPKKIGGKVVARRAAAKDGSDQARNNLGGHVGADANYTLTSLTGSVRKTKKEDDIKMTLTPEERAMVNGDKGPVVSKGIRTIIRYGELFGATKLVPLQGAPHMALSWGSDVIVPFLDIYRLLADNGLKSYAPFTADPKPVDYDNLPMSPEETKALKALYNRLDELEEVNLRLGMIKDAWSCACYLPELGNIPKMGDNLAWSESSAINFANSALGARTNRNSMGIDMLCSVFGKAPYFGMLTDEGRRADWLIDVRIGKDELDHMPHPEMVGAAVGMKCLETTPYIIGMDKFLPQGVCEETTGYIKDFGAATASNGALALYHMEGVTPEAIKYGRSLLNPGYQTYVIDVPELKRIYESYPNLWKKGEDTPDRVFLGCPHLSYSQYVEWGERIVNALEKEGKSKVAIEVSMFGAQVVLDEFKKRNEETYKKLVQYDVKFPICCPLMWCTSPVANAEKIATSSNKTRVYSTARFFFDAALTHLIVHGELPPKLIQVVADKNAGAKGCSSSKSGDIEDLGVMQ